ncbi:FAD-dependent oxidoreductase [Blastopirellula marina]|uniref:NADH-dependent oxidoreductase n=1 Tax=Blastopirellula marina TaxID=124 RepID=A0A2S8FTJ3_9BACT|nr:NADH-dependent oxidoreductase [Blastopirellula marina]PQO41633.1 NADH-dependent oxidoreductase [Blastopirellula marina]PTL44148.1 FAD-dependent oxidoreductase [Blastopirellula marina]
MLFLLAFAVPSFGQSVLVEAESFDQSGGWKLDTQFIREMGSPYLLAHGLGSPVADATTKVTFPETGEYKVFVRTKDWVARWDAPGTPGRFQLLVDGKPLAETFGTQGAEWAWQAGGSVNIDSKEVELKLHDLTGFDGRCDAIYFTKDGSTPPSDDKILSAWRRDLLGLEEAPTVKDGYDLVVVGGGYSGMGAAISAARMGCKVALIQDRPVLGGNGSSEVRVWAMGNIRRGKYPRIGEIVEEFSDHAKKSPGTYEEFGDEKKEEIVRAEPNIDLFLNHHAYKVDKDGDKKISGVYAFDTRTSEQKRFSGKLYVDCTGHGTIGYLAEADFDMAEKGRMGMSNMWAWAEGDEERKFPETPWALDLSMKDFPYPRDHHGQWFWESGFDKDPLGDAEGIRDWNLRAVYGAFNAMKNKDGADQHKPAFLTWVAYVGGPRESRLLQGDVVLTQDDIVSKRDFSDGCVPSTWSIDLHYPKKQFAEKFPDNPFISIAVHDQRVDRNYGYPVPYRCFYSRNIDNLFMAGRCISVDHQALGTVRVMKTCGMMGEVVGKAASIAATYDCTPREVYERYWPEMDELLKLPGKAHRAKLSDDIEVPSDVPPLAGPYGPPTGLDPAKLPGTVVDDSEAERIGKWTSGTGLKGYVGYGYLYAGGDSGGAVRFAIEAPEAGLYDVRFAYQPHENRGKTVPVLVETKTERLEKKINQQQVPPIEGGFISLGELQLDKGEVVTVVVATAGAGGNVHADAVQLVPVKK